MGETPEKRKRGEARIAFMAVLPTIREELEQGWTAKTVFERHSGALGMSYPQFCRYVAQHVKGVKPAAKEATTNVQREEPAKPVGFGADAEKPAAGETSVPKVGQIGQPGFNFNPTAKSRKDLI